MRVHLDTSVLVALLTHDPSTARADAFFRSTAPIPVVSDFAAIAFASALARRVRTGEIDATAAQAAFRDLDAWIGRVAERVETTSFDIAEATRSLRRLDLTLRAPDAIDIAICRRSGAALATFDAKMAIAANRLGVSLISA